MSALLWHDGDFKWHAALASSRSKSSAHIGDVGWSASRGSGHVWPGLPRLVPPLILCLSGSQKPLPAGRRPLQFPHHDLFMLALINGLCICNETHTDWDVEEDDLFNLSRSLIHSPTPLVTCQRCTAWTGEEAKECGLHATSVTEPKQLHSV